MDTLRAPANVAVPDPLLTTNATIVFPFGVIVPVPIAVILKLV